MGASSSDGEQCLGPGPPARVRAGRDADAAFAGRLHAQAISDGFLSELGPRFLALLYRRIVRSEGSFLVVAVTDDDLPVGFLAGSEAVGALYREFLVRDGARAAAAAPLELARSWRRALETVRYGRHQGRQAPGSTPRETSGAELLSVAVDAHWQGRHVGGLLVGAFLAELASRGLVAAHVVVGADNMGAIALYRRAGFVVAEHIEVHAGTRSVRMEWAAPQGSAP